jgi:hypothetical protein
MAAGGLAWLNKGMRRHGYIGRRKRSASYGSVENRNNLRGDGVSEGSLKRAALR